jgi:hypothetical protein
VWQEFGALTIAERPLGSGLSTNVLGTKYFSLYTSISFLDLFTLEVDNGEQYSEI